MNPEAQRIQEILSELIRVTDGLLEETDYPFTVAQEYLVERVNELDPETTGRVLIFSVLDLIKAYRIMEKGNE